MSGIAYTFSLNCDNYSLTQPQLDSLREQGIWADICLINGQPCNKSYFSVYKLVASSLQEAIDSTVERIRTAAPEVGQLEANL